jgi:hypothetical protein
VWCWLSFHFFTFAAPGKMNDSVAIKWHLFCLGLTPFLQAL